MVSQCSAPYSAWPSSSSVDCFKRNLLPPFLNEQLTRFHRVAGQVRGGVHVWGCLARLFPKRSQLLAAGNGCGQSEPLPPHGQQPAAQPHPDCM